MSNAADTSVTRSILLKCLPGMSKCLPFYQPPVLLLLGKQFFNLFGKILKIIPCLYCWWQNHIMYVFWKKFCGHFSSSNILLYCIFFKYRKFYLSSGLKCLLSTHCLPIWSGHTAEHAKTYETLYQKKLRMSPLLYIRTLWPVIVFGPNRAFFCGKKVHLDLFFWLNESLKLLTLYIRRNVFRVNLYTEKKNCFKNL